MICLSSLLFGLSTLAGRLPERHGFLIQPPRLRLRVTSSFSLLVHHTSILRLLCSARTVRIVPPLHGSPHCPYRGFFRTFNYTCRDPVTNVPRPSRQSIPGTLWHAVQRASCTLDRSYYGGGIL
ncbi:hypothetical protein FN846DRAFT_940196 [Sphaerosporella brunnea]|uniref:Secreted protein n=1 Tax=Sphaerosporella brunnea TaxID=1250544 RepID=A0A5J5F254_9PEZI|nr:hypothetical protein FN846DRAFT_940196 [Sphaerosporella brunnea]